MSTISRTYTFTDGTTAYGSQVDSEIANIVNTWNSHDAGTSIWTSLKAAALTMSGNIVMATNKITGLGNGTATTDGAAFGQIHLLQVPVMSTETTGASTVSTSFVDAGPSLSITLASTNSKVLVFACGPAANSGTGSAIFGISHGGADIFTTTTAPTRCQNTDVQTASICYLDSPATAGAIAYKIRLASSSGANTAAFGGGAATGSSTIIILCEVV